MADKSGLEPFWQRPDSSPDVMDSMNQFFINAKRPRSPIDVGPAPLNTFPPSTDNFPDAQTSVNQQNVEAPQLQGMDAVQSMVDPGIMAQLQSQMAWANSPEMRKRQQQAYDASLAAQQEQQKAIAGQEANLQKIEAMPNQVNMQPLNSLVDTWTGSNFAQNYKQPETPQEVARKLYDLRDKLITQKKGLTAEHVALLKSMPNPMQSALGMARLNNQGTMIGFKQDAQSAQAAQAIQSHPLMVESNRQLGFINRDKHTIEGGAMITPQMLHEISNGIAAALGGGKSVGLGISEQQDLSTSQTKIAKLESYLENAPKEGASPAVKKQILDTLDRLEAAYGQYQGNLAKKLSVGKSYLHNPQARTSIQNVVNSYQPKDIKTQSQPNDFHSMSDEDLEKAYKAKMGIK